MKRLLLIFASVLMLSGIFEVTNAQQSQGPGDAVITHPPLNSTVALESNTTFTCSGYGTIVWQVNHVQILSKDVRDGLAADFGIFANNNDRNTSQLAILASTRNNGSRIECVMRLSLTDAVTSQAAFIYVYGSPHPPSNLMISQSGLELYLSWEAPFSLEGENITYIVRATNTGTGMSTDWTTTTPQLVFSESIGQRDCSLYEFRVYSVNPFGQSNTSINGNHIIPTKPKLIHSTDVVWNISMENGTSVTLTFNVPTPCDVYPLNSLNVVLDRILPRIHNATSSDLYLPEIVPHSDDTFVDVLVEESDGLLRNSVYVVTIEAVNEVGSTLSEEVVIYTTGLQSSSVVLEVDDTASVTCNFALGSDALGCEVSFYASSMSDSMELLFAQNITREPSSNTVTQNIPLMGQLEGRAVNITVLTAEWLAEGSVSSIEIDADVQVIEPIILTTTMDVPTSVPTEQHDTTDTTNSFISSITISTLTPNPKKPGTLYIIFGAISAFVVVLLLLVITTVLFIVSLRLRKKAAVENHLSDDQIMEPNVAYGALDKSKRRKNRVRNGVNITQGIGNEPTVQEMVANTAYGVLVAEGGSRPPPLPPKSHRNNRNLEVSLAEPGVQEMVPNQAYGVSTSHLTPHKRSGAVDNGNSPNTLHERAEISMNGVIRAPCASAQASLTNVGVASYEDVDIVFGCSPAYEEIKNSLRTQSGPLYEEIKAKTKGPHLSVVYDDVILK